MTTPRDSHRPFTVTPDGQITDRTPATTRAEARWQPDTDPRVFQPAVWQPPVTGTALQHAAGSARPRIVDSATAPLREALGNVLAVVQAGALLLVSLAAAVTVLLLLTRVWGWLL